MLEAESSGNQSILQLVVSFAILFGSHVMTAPVDNILNAQEQCKAQQPELALSVTHKRVQKHTFRQSQAKQRHGVVAVSIHSNTFDKTAASAPHTERWKKKKKESTHKELLQNPKFAHTVHTIGVRDYITADVCSLHTAHAGITHTPVTQPSSRDSHGCRKRMDEFPHS